MDNKVTTEEFVQFKHQFLQLVGKNIKTSKQKMKSAAYAAGNALLTSGISLVIPFVAPIKEPKKKKHKLIVGNDEFEMLADIMCGIEYFGWPYNRRKFESVKKIMLEVARTGYSETTGKVLKDYYYIFQEV